MDAVKTINALSFFSEKANGEYLENMKAYKLMWLADRYHLCRYGRPVTEDDYWALPKGVVPSDAKNILEGTASRHLVLPDNFSLNDCFDVTPNHRYKARKAPDMKVFSQSDVEIMEWVWEKYGKMSAQDLSDLSHDSPEWIEARGRLSGSDANQVNMDCVFSNFTSDKAEMVPVDAEQLELSRELYHMYYGNPVASC